MNLNALFNNRIRIRAIDAEGHCKSEFVVKNTLTFAASDVMINALLRSGPSQVTHLYARYGDQGSNTAWIAPFGGDLRTTTRDDFIMTSGVDPVRGGLWVPILSAPAKDSTDTDLYSGNRATFFFRIPANISTDQMSPAHFNAVSSGIYSLGLGVAASLTDRTQDLIISVLQISEEDRAKAIVPVGGQLAIDYPLEHTTGDPAVIAEDYPI